LSHSNQTLQNLLQRLDLGSSVAEFDGKLEIARVETSAFSDILLDRVDLVPGTKGSGKTALFRIFVDFLPDHLLQSRKVVIAHGVQKEGDSIFLAFKDQFEKLSEDDFVSFWCIYLTSLTHEQFIKGDRYQSFLEGAAAEIDEFRKACAIAGIPEIKAKKNLSEILAWALNVLRSVRPKFTYTDPATGGEFALHLFGSPDGAPAREAQATEPQPIPEYIIRVKVALEKILRKTNLNVWLMIDRLDEIFPRRSELESKALRGLLRVMRLFTTPEIRVKVFLRDDMLENMLSSGEGFTAMTHVTARQADTLRWSEEQIQTFVVKRLFANKELRDYCQLDKDRLDASADYRHESFYKVFPPRVHPGPNQSSTIRWIYSHTQDGRSVVTPRDVLDLLTKARQRQLDFCMADSGGKSAHIIGSEAIRYGLEELSKKKRRTYLEAEFPHIWPHIEKLVGGKTEYSRTALQKLLGKDFESIVADLVSLGVLRSRTRKNAPTYWIPFVYRKGLDVSQGKA